MIIVAFLLLANTCYCYANIYWEKIIKLYTITNFQTNQNSSF